MSLERAEGAANIFLESYKRAAERNARAAAEWPPECLASEEKFGHRAARLYPLIGKHNGVRTPEGIGTLWQAFSGRCLVLLLKTRPKTVFMGKKTNRYRPMTPFAVEDIKPYRTEKR